VFRFLPHFHNNWQNSWATLGLIKEIFGQTVTDSTLQLTPVKAILRQIVFHGFIDNVRAFAQNISALLNIDKSTGMYFSLGNDFLFLTVNCECHDENTIFRQDLAVAEDDITHIDFLHGALKTFPELISFRYNPGPLKQGGNAIIGKPEEAKYGLTREQLFEAYARCKKEGVERFGLHTMVASNELNPDFFIDTADILFDLCVEIKQRLGIKIEFVDLGGGVGIPYKPEQKAVDLGYVARGIKKLYDEKRENLDAIFIDTSGYSPNDTENIGKMKAVLDVRGMKPDIYLAVAASTKATDLANIMQNYEQFGYNSVIVTKCDESKQYGNVISVLHEKNKKISYIADGQKVVRDIHRADVVQFLIRLSGFDVDRVHIEDEFGE